MFRFTIRDLLWMTVVVALAMGWVVNYHQLAVSRTQRDDARNKLVKVQTVLSHQNVALYFDDDGALTVVMDASE